MRESRTYGSVRGALSNGRPYRARSIFAASVHTEELPDRAVAEGSRPEQDESDQPPPCARADEDEAEQD
jgi:hypothetical protein